MAVRKVEKSRLTRFLDAIPGKKTLGMYRYFLMKNSDFTDISVDVPFIFRFSAF
jgi:hypothetical protein